MNLEDNIDNPLLRCTPQLFYYPFYTEEDKKKVLHPEAKQVGSSVLFQTYQDFFLITAKHVFDNIKISDIIIYLNGDSVIRLPIEAGFLIPFGEHDNKDIIIIKLFPEQVEHIKSRYFFLDHNHIDFRHEFAKDKLYLLMGFINNQTELSGAQFLSTPFPFITRIKELKKISALGFNYEENITLVYNRRQQSLIDNNSVNFGPKDLKGLSGGGIWHLINDLDNPRQFRYFLVGIMIEERTNRGILIGTKISLALNILWHRFDNALKV